MYAVIPWPHLEEAMLVYYHRDAMALYSELQEQLHGDAMLLKLNRRKNSRYDPAACPDHLTPLEHALLLNTSTIEPRDER